MSGKFTGIQARVKDREPRAEFVHCAARSLNLATQDAMHNIQECRHMFLMVKELTNAFRESPKRMASIQRVSERRGTFFTTLVPNKMDIKDQ